MASADRLLDLLALMAARVHWTAGELAERLEVTERTVRRDMARLREIGYAVESDSGPHGGYRLSAGTRLPPLVIDDDEALMVALGLSAMTTSGAGPQLAAVSALSKLDRIMPPRLRERSRALHTMTLGLTGSRIPAADPDSLVTIALACERPERLRFDYCDAADRHSTRWVEPYRLVFTSMRWYLVAFDTDRDAWRTFRVDRMADLFPSGVPFERGEVPDATAQVAAGLAVHAHDTVATIRFRCTRSDVERVIPRTIGVIDEASPDGDIVVRIGGELDWIAQFLLGVEEPFRIVEPPQLVTELRAAAQRVLDMHPPVPR